MKNKINLIGLMTTIILFSGCTPVYHLAKPGMTKDQKETDEIECKYEAEKAVVTINDPIRRGFQTTELTNKCMEFRGYKWEKIEK